MGWVRVSGCYPNAGVEFCLRTSFGLIRVIVGRLFSSTVTNDPRITRIKTNIYQLKSLDLSITVRKIGAPIASSHNR